MTTVITIRVYLLAVERFLLYANVLAFGMAPELLTCFDRACVPVGVGGDLASFRD